MTARRMPSSLAAPNVFDAYVNQNLLLYLVLSNLLSPATWEFSGRIRERARQHGGGAEPSDRLLIEEIQGFIDHNFQHLHTQDVARLYGELDIAAEKARLGSDAVERALAALALNLETRAAAGGILEDAFRPVLNRIAEGVFPAYFYGTIDVVRANRKATGKPHSSVKGLTSCVDETAIFASLAMTMPRGAIANVVALAGPAHTTAFGWNGDGEAWWFHGKNRLYFAGGWREYAAATGGAQAAFDTLHEDFSRVVSAAGTFDLDSGETNLPDDHIDEIATRMDQFFGLRLRQLENGLSKPRQHAPEDPLAPYLRSLLGATSIAEVFERLGDSRDEACQGVLYAFRSLAVRDLHPYAEAARGQPAARALALGLPTLDDALAVLAGIRDAESLLGSRDRITMPDETLRFRAGTDRDKALLLYALLAHMDARDGVNRPLAALLGERKSFVQYGDRVIDVSAGDVRTAPDDAILFTLS